MNPEQLALFSSATARGHRTKTTLPISPETLHHWKTQIATYQHQIQTTPALTQGVLFDTPSPSALPETPTDPDRLNPFQLPQQNTEFWRWKAADSGVPALYFVIDYELPLLLYVGETVKSNQRWQGEHDCKRYLLNYRQVHYQHDVPTLLGIAFWPHAPATTRSRQQIEQLLIRKWGAPFNKENWERWGTPFT